MGISVCLYVCVSLFLAGSRYDPKSYRCSRRLSRNPEAAPVSTAGRGRPLSFYETSDKRPLARISVSFVNLSNPRPCATHSFSSSYMKKYYYYIFFFSLIYYPFLIKKYESWYVRMCVIMKESILIYSENSY